MKKSRIINIALLASVALPTTVFAAEKGADTGALSYMAVGCVIGLGLAAFGGSIGMGNAISSGLSSIARNPGIYNRLFPTLLIGLALIESLVIYTLVIVLLLLYANPL